MSGTVSAKLLIGALKRKRAISSPLAGKLARKGMLVDVALLDRILREAARHSRPEPIGQLWNGRSSRVAAGRYLHRSAYIDAPATPFQKSKLQKLSPEDVKESD
jgi:hypothetical protein